MHIIKAAVLTVLHDCFYFLLWNALYGVLKRVCYLKWWGYIAVK